MANIFTKSGFDLGMVTSNGDQMLSFYRDVIGMEFEATINMEALGVAAMHRLWANESLLKIVVPTKKVDAGIAGVILQVLDPAEVEFPYRGRAVFQSPLKRLQHDSLQAADLRAQYLERLAARRDGLASLAKDAGWQLIDYVSNANPISALLQLHKALGQEGRRG